MKRSSQVRVTGPLALYAVGFKENLAKQGYSVWTALSLLQLMARLSEWMAASEVGPAGLTPEILERFLTDRKASGQVRRLSPRGLIPLLGYLREVGVVPPATPRPVTGPVGELLDRFAHHLETERGLAMGTIRAYRDTAARFLYGRAVELGGNCVGLANLAAEEIGAFVLGESARRSAGSLGNVVTALRSLLRFLYLQGYTGRSMVGALPTAPGWRDRGLSRALAPDLVRRLLASCDRRTAAGKRDFAILVLMSRLGLRAGEIAALSLDDIDWRTGQIEVTGKGDRRALLPLPVDIGQALAAYCRRRRQGSNRSLFLHVRAPYATLTSAAVSHVVVRACDRAGLPRVGAHRLRHSAASAMRRAGAPLFEIGQVLRHQHVETTAVYARDDQEALRQVARPWPGGEL